MGFAFNPFTGNFDAKGSGGGGGGSAFFAGEVATYADLPLDGTAALNSRWLVRSNSGTWPFSSYKQAGVYVRTATGGTDRDADYDLTDTSFHDVMSDSAFVLFDDGDATKNLKFQLSGIDTATTRTLTAPNASGTIARTEDFAAPPAIGNTTPNSGAFTTLNATGTTELVNGTNAAGPFRLYNTSSSANANYERGFMQWTSNNFEIGCEAAGTGTLRNVRIKTDATSGASGQGYIEFGGSSIINSIKSVGGTANGALYIFSQGTLRMLIGGSSGTQFYQAIFPNGNQVLDIGLTGTRWRDVFCRSVDLTGNLILPTATGTQIGTATNQLLGFYGVTPVDQPATVADPAGGGTVDTEARTAINAIIDRLQELGLIA